MIPIISEKSMHDARKGTFTFRAPPHVDKKTIRRSIEKQFKVHVSRIRTSIVKGRTKRVGVQRKVVGQSPWKRVAVTLKSGEKIDLFDVGGAS